MLFMWLSKRPLTVLLSLSYFTFTFPVASYVTGLRATEEVFCVNIRKKQKIESLCRGISTALKAKFRHNRGAIATTVLLPKVNTTLSNTCTRSREVEQQLITQRRRKMKAEKAGELQFREKKKGVCSSVSEVEKSRAIYRRMPSRLRLVLDKLISPSQNAFVLGRSIGDNILLAQELFAGYNRQGLPMRCALKVDLRKAYDTVEWDFLSAVLQLFGFPGTFIGWVEECVTTPMFSVCINGNPHGFFKGARGLRQGDPMSPFLFVLIMEMTSFYCKADVASVGFLDTGWTNSPNCPSYMLTTKESA
ncbi:UNVERIFIED_CONTAM: hypothetical protein Scaly_1919000 [Sesamum calycinum]|uniref:Reverse transcriptase domain-containing protein n=1 Tax=Sesamum calycinum TaxID=2727403 RepID=A0AAW2NIB3_9LAMI